jgi:beta-1,2-mannobiose phosphorylase / 1,2-beta-oligomannan phosphorylase
MLRRLTERLLLRPEDLQPSRDGFRIVGVFNPGAVRVDDGSVILLVRVAELPEEERPGYVPLARWQANGELVTDWVAEDELSHREARGVKLASGFWRLTSVSHIRVARSADGLSIDEISEPMLAPGTEMDEYGIEDPRITRIGDRYYVTYVAVSRHGIAAALASTQDFIHFDRHGVIFPPENKDVVVFPEQIGGRYVALHRPMSRTFTAPQIWTARSDNLEEWGHHAHLASGAFPWEGERIGAGPPPIRTDLGWLAMHHGSATPQDGTIGTYSAGALLLDIDEPDLVLRRTPEPIITPTASFERNGFVGDVVFPSGLVDNGDTLLVYYGAADTATAVVELALGDVLQALL